MNNIKLSKRLLKIANIVSGSNDNLEEITSKVADINMKREDEIKLFIQLCNNGKVDAAYSLLADECKETLYPTKQSFIDSYYGVIFKICHQRTINNSEYMLGVRL